MLRMGSVSAFLISGLALVGCSDDAAKVTVADAGSVFDAAAAKADDDAAPAKPAVDGGGALAATAKRGAYLVRTVLGCVDCHSPTKMEGMRAVPDTAKEFQGRLCQTDTLPAEMGKGCIHSANLTNHETGLKNLSDGELRKIVTSGLREGGKKVHGAMPYWAYALLNDNDLSSIVMFLRTIPGVENRIPAHEEPHDKGAAEVVKPLVASELPVGADTAASKNGRYLAGMACLACHTPTLNGPAGAAPNRPIDMAKAFSGARWFGPPMPPSVQSANLTPDESGLKGWTAEQIARAVREGIDKEGKKVCPPMPSGPMGLYKDLAESDATDMAAYFLSLTPVKSDIVMNCSM